MENPIQPYLEDVHTWDAQYNRPYHVCNALPLAMHELRNEFSPIGKHLNILLNSHNLLQQAQTWKHDMIQQLFINNHFKWQSIHTGNRKYNNSICSHTYIEQHLGMYYVKLQQHIFSNHWNVLDGVS